MTDVSMEESDVITPTETAPEGAVAADAIDEQLVSQLTERAQTQGLRLLGEGGLLARLTKIVLEGAAEGEMDAHLATASTMRPAAMAGTPATVIGLRQC